MTAAAVRILTPHEKRLADRDHALLTLVYDQVAPAGLSPRRETELVQAGADRLRRMLDQLETATVQAAALEREDRAADHHINVCTYCVTWRVVRSGACRVFRQIRRNWDRQYHAYARAFRRLERC